jgi:phosphoglycolate phosphatase
LSNKRLVLFDVDGTLLWPDGAGRESMRAALVRVYGTAGAIDSHKFGGKTDRSTVLKLMEGAGLRPELIWQHFDRFGDVMEEELRRLIAEGHHDIQPCPGARDLIAHLAAHDDVVLGLLTGNFHQTSRVKIETAGFDPTLFTVGAYGNEAEERSDLPPIAVKRAGDLTGLAFKGQQVVIIGDTANDVTCGRGIGVRTIALLTGWSTREALEAVSPDYLLDDLVDQDAVLSAIFSPVD